MSNATPDRIAVGDVDFIRADLCQQAETGNRQVIVVDRGWIFAGDATQTDTEITLSRVVHVFKWESIGFNGMISNPKSDKVDLRKMANQVKIPHASVIFAIPVSESWGL
jgi:hypothetical protein